MTVLPILSKLFYKHICDHLYDFKFLEENALLHHLQFGFRKFHSTSCFLLRQKQCNRASIYWLQECIWPHGPWFPSDETEWGRRQHIVIDGWRCSSRSVAAGVPHVSILGPIMFLLFINDQSLAAQRSTVDIYADDTTLSFTSDVTNWLLGISSSPQQDQDDLSHWSAVKKMAVNAAETKCLVVTGKRLTNKIVDGSLNFSSWELKYRTSG